MVKSLNSISYFMFIMFMYHKGIKPDMENKFIL